MQRYAYILPRYNERKLAELEAEKNEPAYQTRASRLDRWKGLVAQAQKDMQLPESPPERLMTLGHET